MNFPEQNIVSSWGLHPHTPVKLMKGAVKKE